MKTFPWILLYFVHALSIPWDGHVCNSVYSYNYFHKLQIFLSHVQTDGQWSEIVCFHSVPKIGLKHLLKMQFNFCLNTAAKIHKDSPVHNFYIWFSPILRQNMLPGVYRQINWYISSRHRPELLSTMISFLTILERYSLLKRGQFVP